MNKNEGVIIKKSPFLCKFSINQYLKVIDLLKEKEKYLCHFCSKNVLPL